MPQPTVLFISLTEDNQKEIARQIEEGKRPQYWDTTGHPDHDIWARILELHPEAGVMVSI